MTYYYNENNKPLAQKLRKNMTPQERQLWYRFLSGYPVRFRRQKQFGRYIVDFYCSAAKIILEIDGGQHYSEEGMEKDRVRTAYLEGLGLKVLRVSNADIEREFRAVCEWIDQNVKWRMGKNFADSD